MSNIEVEYKAGLVFSDLQVIEQALSVVQFS